MKALLACAVFFVTMGPALSAEKSLPELINDLGVEDKGNCTCNTACGILMLKKDEAVPYLEEALTNPNERIRYYAVRTLGEINTDASRHVLIRAFSDGRDDVRPHAGYALTWHPHSDAEQVYIEFLNEKDRWHAWHAVEALGTIKSQKAVPRLEGIRENPESWKFYYTAVVALRKITDQGLSQEVADALAFLREAKYASDIDEKKLNASAAVIRSNIETALPDVFGLYVWVTKGNESDREPNAVTLIGDAGERAYPYIAIGLRDANFNVRYKFVQLVESLSLARAFPVQLEALAENDPETLVRRKASQLLGKEDSE
jgi:HEAT repeat protein